MAGSRNNTDQPAVRRRPPATSPEQLEKRLYSLAMAQIEEQLVEKRASSQVLTQLMKMASVQAELEKEKLRKEILQLEAKTRSLEAESRMEQLAAGAIEAMTSYGRSINHMDEDCDD